MSTSSRHSGLPGASGGEVPHRVHHRGQREVDDALLRAEPAQLRVGLQLAVDAAEVLDDLLDVAADQGRGRAVAAASTHRSLPRPMVKVKP